MPGFAGNGPPGTPNLDLNELSPTFKCENKKYRNIYLSDVS